MVKYELNVLWKPCVYSVPQLSKKKSMEPLSVKKLLMFLFLSHILSSYCDPTKEMKTRQNPFFVTPSLIAQICIKSHIKLQSLLYISFAVFIHC